MVLPDGFVLPPTSYLLVLAAGLLVVGFGLYRLDPPVTPRTVLAVLPWMALGGALHVLEVLDLAPAAVAPLLGTPAVYATTAILAGCVPLLAHVTGRVHQDVALASVGLALLLVVVLAILGAGLAAGTLTPLWPLAGLVVAILLAAILWAILLWFRPGVADVTAGAGVAVVFGHALDGISTAIGVDVFGAGERSPIPRTIMQLAEQLPTAEVIGVGWAFVVVKALVALAIVYLFVPFVRETERQGYLLLMALAAVGLGPGAHNLLLFLVAG